MVRHCKPNEEMSKLGFSEELHWPGLLLSHGVVKYKLVFYDQEKKRGDYTVSSASHKCWFNAFNGVVVHDHRMTQNDLNHGKKDLLKADVPAEMSDGL